jgi:hypothetical protein
LATYATQTDLDQYLIGSDVSPPDDAEALLRRAETAVDGALGPYPVNASTGLKLDPGSLTTIQRDALARATAAAAEHELIVGRDWGDDFAPPNMMPLRRASTTSEQMLRELAGFALVTYSGCAQPTPDEAVT